MATCSDEKTSATCASTAEYSSAARPSTAAASSPLTKAVALLAAAEPKSNTPDTVSSAGLPDGSTNDAAAPGSRP